MTERNEEMKKWHTLTPEEVVAAQEVSMEAGLAESDVLERLKRYGPNKLPEGQKRSALMRFLIQFHNVLIYLLLFAAVVTALMDHLVDTFVIIGVVVINAGIGFIQEGKAEKALEGIKKMLSLDALVIRAGKRNKIKAEELVPGDIVLLKSGDKVPADMRLLYEKNLRVEESPLTGESTDVTKTTKPVSADAVLGDRKNMVYSGTLVTYGEARGVVVATGVETEIGKITTLISEVEKITTPLLQKMDRFGKVLSLIILVIASGFFAFGYLVRDYTYVEMFLATISMVVAAIPEGLPAIVTIALAIGVQRMAKRNAIIRRLPSVETLGAVNVICSDKTGTLTRNEMTAKTIMTAETRYDVSGGGYKPEGEIRIGDTPVSPGEDKVLEMLISAARICNDGDIKLSEDGQWQVIGTATEGALVTLAHKAGVGDIDAPRLDAIPFESANKFMATLNEWNGDTTIFFKGAPERVMSYCNRQLTASGEAPLDADCWHNSMDTIARKGERVIALAYRKAPGQTTLDLDTLGSDFIFLGFVGIMDPPREEALTAIEACKKAGIRVIMITGDHSVTAEAIARQLGISNGEEVITGAQLEKMSEEELHKVVMETNVFARTDPEHKLRLVRALQANGLLCAMTGDGVNDAPALKRANIGIAMGIKGTEVSKEAAEIILTDDNFASIVNAVEEGRTVYDNIRKTILFILPTNGAESLVLMAAIILGITMPITPVQILWVNMVTAVTLALSLVFEPMENQVMEKPPRDKDEPMLGRYFLMRTLFVSLVIGIVTFLEYNVIYDSGENLEYARTVAVNMLVAGQAFYLLNCRKIHESTIGKGFFDNHVVFMAMGILIVFQMLFTYAPFMNLFFGTVPIDLADWFYPFFGGLAVFLIVEAEKYITRRFF